jgi:hypothetical protein
VDVIVDGVESREHLLHALIPCLASSSKKKKKNEDEDEE